MGNLIFGTTTIQGRRFDNIKVQTSKAGVPRPIIFGRVLPVVGNIIATTAPKIVKKKDKQKGGKGGPSTVVENEEVYRTYAIRICEGPITGISRVWRNNELVYHRDSRNRTQIENNWAFLRIADFFLGGWGQRPSSVMQAAFGVHNVHAYRGTCYLVIDNENLTSTGGAIPQYAFEVERAEGFVLTSKPYAIEVADGVTCRPGVQGGRTKPDYVRAMTEAKLARFMADPGYWQFSPRKWRLTWRMACCTSMLPTAGRLPIARQRCRKSPGTPVPIWLVSWGRCWLRFTGFCGRTKQIDFICVISQEIVILEAFLNAG